MEVNEIFNTIIAQRGAVWLLLVVLMAILYWGYRYLQDMQKQHRIERKERKESIEKMNSKVSTAFENNTQSITQNTLATNELITFIKASSSKYE